MKKFIFTMVQIGAVAVICLSSDGRAANHPVGSSVTASNVIQRDVHRELLQQFIELIRDATDIRIPFYEEEFPWRIDWVGQQKYCGSVWNALTNERTIRFQYLDKPAISATKDGDAAFVERWDRTTLLKGSHQYIDSSRPSSMADIVEREIFDFSPSWVLAIQYMRTQKVGERSPTLSGYLSFATELYTWGSSQQKYLDSRRDYSRQPDPSNFPFAAGGIEQIFALVDGHLLRIRYGRYVEAFDKRQELLHADATSVIWKDYAALFGRRKGRIGQGFVAIESHEATLYRSFALEKTGYVEAGTGVVPDGDGPVLDMAWDVEYHMPVCVINFDVN